MHFTTGFSKLSYPTKSASNLTYPASKNRYTQERAGERGTFKPHPSPTRLIPFDTTHVDITQSSFSFSFTHHTLSPFKFIFIFSEICCVSLITNYKIHTYNHLTYTTSPHQENIHHQNGNLHPNPQNPRHLRLRAPFLAQRRNLRRERGLGESTGSQEK